MKKFKFDTTQKGLLTIFKHFEIPILEHLWTVEEGDSRKVWLAVCKSIAPKEISRASIIFSMNKMVGWGLLSYYETTTKGGYKKVYSPLVSEDGLDDWVVGKLLEEIATAFPHSNLLPSGDP